MKREAKYWVGRKRLLTAIGMLDEALALAETPLDVEGMRLLVDDVIRRHERKHFEWQNIGLAK